MLMPFALEPGLLKDLAEARAAIARHGIVIARAIESDLVPAIMAEVRASLESSPRKLAAIEEDDLDSHLEKIRKASTKSAEQLRDTYVRWLTKLGAGSPADVIGDLEGVGELFKWERISKTAEPASEILRGLGFRGVELLDAADVSDSLKLELDERWPPAYERLRELLVKASEESAKLESEEAASAKAPRKKPTKKR